MSSPSPQHDGHAAEALAHAAPHGPSVRLYVIIGIVLTVVTVIEIFVPAWVTQGQVELRPSLGLVVGLLAMAFVKAGLVAAFYMHLRYDSKVYSTVMFLASLVTAYFLWLLTFSEGINFQMFR